MCVVGGGVGGVCVECVCLGCGGIVWVCVVCVCVYQEQVSPSVP